MPYFSCRGNVSITEMHQVHLRLSVPERNGPKPVIFHFGDHDPNGIDMSRDIVDRLETFGTKVEFHRVALNMDQVEQYGLPPNFAKEEDPRFKDYKAKYGEKCWELDALDPVTLRGSSRTRSRRSARSGSGRPGKSRKPRVVDAHRRGEPVERSPGFPFVRVVSLLEDMFLSA